MALLRVTTEFSIYTMPCNISAWRSFTLLCVLLCSALIYLNTRFFRLNLSFQYNFFLDWHFGIRSPP